MPDDDNQLLEIRKLDVLFRQAPPALTGSFFVALVLYTFLVREFITGVLIAWFLIFTLLTFARLGGVLAYRKNSFFSRSYKTALNLYAISTIIAGFMWGILSVYLLNLLDNELIYFMLICIVGLTAASVSTYSTSRICFLFFLVPSLMPLTIALFLHEQAIMNAIGVLIVIYTIFLNYSCSRVNSLMIKALKFEIVNQRLAEEKNQVNLLNEDLRGEINKRELSERKLLDEKNKAQALTEELIKLSSLDGLTKINNRRRFDEFLASEWNRALRDKNSLSLILCDIDFFKSYNDTYGHQAGDECLIRIAITLESFARRAGDFAARYGGEEFAIVLPNTDRKVAEDIAEQIRQAILALKIPHAGSTVHEFVSVSFGISELTPTAEMNPSSLVRQADKALYQAKLGGRNRVSSYEERN